MDQLFHVALLRFVVVYVLVQLDALLATILAVFCHPALRLIMVSAVEFQSGYASMLLLANNKLSSVMNSSPDSVITYENNSFTAAS